MSAPTSSSRTSTVVGIVLGLLILGAMAAFAIGLPKAHGEEQDDARVLELPDTLPGGYVASDDPAAFDEGELAEQADEIADGERESRDLGNDVLPEVLGTSAATRTYVVDGSQPLFVQVFESEGGAFAPPSLPVPAEDGSVSTEMTTVGDGACILTYGQPTGDGSEPEPVSSRCQVTHDGLTVQVESGAVDAEELVDVADALLDDLAAA